MPAISVSIAVTGAAADGAIFATIFNLTKPRSEQGWAIDGTARELAIGDSRVTVRVENEAGRINPNWASPALLEALLRVTGGTPDSAQRLAAAITEWAGLRAKPGATKCAPRGVSRGGGSITDLPAHRWRPSTS